MFESVCPGSFVLKNSITLIALKVLCNSLYEQCLHTDWYKSRNKIISAVSCGCQHFYHSHANFYLISFYIPDLSMICASKRAIVISKNFNGEKISSDFEWTMSRFMWDIHECELCLFLSIAAWNDFYSLRDRRHKHTCMLSARFDLWMRKEPTDKTFHRSKSVEQNLIHKGYNQ